LQPPWPYRWRDLSASGGGTGHGLHDHPSYRAHRRGGPLRGLDLTRSGDAETRGALNSAVTPRAIRRSTMSRTIRPCLQAHIPDKTFQTRGPPLPCRAQPRGRGRTAGELSRQGLDARLLGAQARKIRDAPGEDTISALRDCAILDYVKSTASRPLNPPHDAFGVRRRPAGRALIFVGSPRPSDAIRAAQNERRQPSPRSSDRIAGRNRAWAWRRQGVASEVDAATACATGFFLYPSAAFIVQRRETRQSCRPGQVFNRSVPGSWG
jgi:hypothetical protein